MFRKSNTKILLAAFIVLLVIVVIIKFAGSGKKKSTFKSELISVDTSLVSSITILPKADAEKEVKLFRENGVWIAESQGKRYDADESVISNLLTEFMRIKPERMAATDESGWEKYEVTDSAAIRITVKETNDNVTDLLVGKFSYQQAPNTNPYQRQQGKMTSYVRLYNEKEVYAVNGFLNMTFNRQINAFRNKTIISADKSDWTGLYFNYPGDSSFAMTKQNGKWMTGGLLADSMEVDKYLNSISHLVCTDFADDIVVTNNPTHTLKIEGSNMPVPLKISAFPADSVNKYIIASSLNTGAKFYSAKQKVFEKLFITRNRFFKAEADSINFSE